MNFETEVNYILSEPNTPSSEAIIFIPGMSGGALSDKYKLLEETALTENIALLRFQSWATVEDLDKKSLSLFQQELQEAIIFLRSKGYTQISGIGKSFGGMILLYVHLKDLNSLVLWAPSIAVSDQETISALWNHPFSQIDSLRHLAVTRDFLSSITTKVLIVWGDKDEIIAIGDLEELQKELSSANLTKIPGMGHSPQGLIEEENLFRLSVSFIKEQTRS